MPADRGRSDAKALRALLARQADEAAAAALQSGGQVEAPRLEELGRLARLVELREAAVTRARSWTVPLIAVATLGAVSVLLFTRVSSTEIEMELKVSELSFVIPTLQVVSEAMAVSSLGAGGLRAIELPGPRADAAAAGSLSILLEEAPVGTSVGTISLDPIAVPGGTRVSLRKEAGPRQYRMMLQGALSDLTVTLHGPVRVVVPPDLDRVRDFPYPQQVALTPGSQRVSLELATGDTGAARRAFRSPLPAESLFLFHLDRFQPSEQTIERQAPTIQSGTLYFESLDGQARSLRAGEGLHLASSVGEIRELRLLDDGVLIRFHGRVRGMSAGSGDVRRSLMPTVLDSVRARHGLSLVWGTTTYLVGLFVALLGWWRRPAW